MYYFIFYHSKTAKMNTHHEEHPYYLVTDSDMEFIYRCIGTAIYIMVAYMVYYHYNVIIKMIVFVMLTGIILYCMVAFFKFLDHIQPNIVDQNDPPHFD